MKKGEIVEGVVQSLAYPNRGVVSVTDETGQQTTVSVKNVLPGQRVRVRITKKRAGHPEGQLLEVTENAPCETRTGRCPHAVRCGGCAYQSLPGAAQRELKAGQVRRLLSPVVGQEVFDAVWEGVLASPLESGYRNKMEFTFGDETPGGPLTLGLHARGSFYDILSVPDCQLADADMRLVLFATRDFFAERGLGHYHRLRHTGYLRHLVLRKSLYTQELMVNLVTASPADKGSESDGGASAGSGAASETEGLGTSHGGGEETAASCISAEVKAAADPYVPDSLEEETLLRDWVSLLESLPLQGTLASVLHTRNNRPADVVASEETRVLLGRSSIEEKLLGLTFQISPFSFFQTNSAAAEVLYALVQDYVKNAVSKAFSDSEVRKKPEAAGGWQTGCQTLAPDASEKETEKPAAGVVYDLYSGTGTITQLLAPAAREVFGIELVEEAVEAAAASASRNGLTNCCFLAGDVQKRLSEIETRPDLIVLDPPRDGVHPKTLAQILSYRVPWLVYISCKPTSLARDLVPILEAGYRPERICCVDMVPFTTGIESVALLRLCSS